MPLDQNATISLRTVPSEIAKKSASEISIYLVDQIYNTDHERRQKYIKATQKYIAMNTSTNPHINDPGNTTYVIKNESEHSKNSKNLYEN
jgi:hypothetical protein